MICVSKFRPFLLGKSFLGHLFNPKCLPKAGRKEDISRGTDPEEERPSSTCSNPLSRLPFSKSQLPFYFLGKSFHCIYWSRPCLENYWTSMTELLRDYLHFRIVLCRKIQCTSLWVIHYLRSAMPSSKQMQGPSGVADSEVRNRRKDKASVKKETCLRERRVPFYETGFLFPKRPYFKCCTTVGTITWHRVNTGEMPDGWENTCLDEGLDNKYLPLSLVIPKA